MSAASPDRVALSSDVSGSASERAPLLETTKGRSYDNGAVEAQVVDEEVIPPVPKDIDDHTSTSKLKLFLRISLVLAAVGVFAIFVKGFIDADDVEVCRQ